MSRDDANAPQGAAAYDDPGGRPLPFSQLIAHILEEHGEERLTLSHLSAQLRHRMWGGLLLLFAAINFLPLPPGTTSVTGIPLVLITAQMAAGRARPWFPQSFDRRGVTKGELRRLLAKLLPWERRVERLLKPRLVALTNRRGARVIGLVSLLLSVILWLPIPLGNHAPALAMILFALALIYRDGALVLLGIAATMASIVMVSFTVGAAWLAFQLAAQHLFPA
jgi:hypothetical protein